MIDKIKGIKNRLDIITLLVGLSKKYKHERFGQLLWNSIYMKNKETTDIFYISDQQIIQCLKERLENNNVK